MIILAVVFCLIALFLSIIMGRSCGNKDVDNAIKVINSTIKESNNTNAYKFKYKNKTEEDGITYINFENKARAIESDSNYKLKLTPKKVKTVCSFLYDKNKFIGMKITTENNWSLAYGAITLNLEKIDLFGFTEDEKKELQQIALTVENGEVGNFGFFMNDSNDSNESVCIAIHEDYYSLFGYKKR